MENIGQLEFQFRFTSVLADPYDVTSTGTDLYCFAFWGSLAGNGSNVPTINIDLTFSMPWSPDPS